MMRIQPISLSFPVPLPVVPRIDCFLSLSYDHNDCIHPSSRRNFPQRPPQAHPRSSPLHPDRPISHHITLVVFSVPSSSTSSSSSSSFLVFQYHHWHKYPHLEKKKRTTYDTLHTDLSSTHQTTPTRHTNIQNYHTDRIKMASTTTRPQNVGIKAIEMYFPKRVS